MFGQGNGTQAPGTGGFPFVTTTTQPTTTASSGFSFGSTTTTSGSSGFSFGGSTGPTPQKPAGSGGFAFSTPTPATQSAGTGLTLGGGQTTKPSGFTFGSTATQPVSGGFTLGGPQNATAQPVSGGFTLGGPQNATSTTSSLGFALGTPAGTGGTGFTLGGQTTVAPATGLTLGGKTTTAAPTGGFTLGGQTTTASTGLTFGGQTTQSSTGFNLGAPSVSAAATTMPSSGTGFTLGSKPTTTPTVTTDGSISLAGKSLQQPVTTTATSTAGGLKLGVATGFTLGGSTATSTATTSTATTGFVLGGATSTTTNTRTTATTTSTAAATTTPQMSFKQLEDTINKWMVELDEQEKIFIQQATQVNAWDRQLIENGEKIMQLNSDVERVKTDQQRLEHELDFIVAQQKELEEVLVPLEKAVDQLPSITYQQHADLEREHTYQMAENIDAQLKRMADDLKEIIDHVNATNSAQDVNDPVNQIAKILNAHMDSLQWVDQNAALLQRKVDEMAKLTEHKRREQERNFRMAYN